MKKSTITAFMVALAVSFSYAPGYAQYKRVPDYRAESKHTDKGVQIASDLIKERSSLAKQYIRPKSTVTSDTAQKICIAVAAKARNTAKDNDIFIIRFVAEKYINPENAPYSAKDRDEKTGLDTLKNGVDRDYWTAATINGEKYYMYMKPVIAEKPCLACHGEEKEVPVFIKKMYPEDKSFGFMEGEMMGATVVYTWKGW